MPERVREVLVAALQQAALEAEAGSSIAAAWTVRHAFDQLQSSSAAVAGMRTARELFAEYDGRASVARSRPSSQSRGRSSVSMKR